MHKIEVKIAPLNMMNVIINMAHFYRYDLSEFTGWGIENDGIYRCYGLEDYWEDENLPFIINVDNELAGFVLLETINERTHEVSEFFVLRKFRRMGIASKVASKLLDRYKGIWIIKQLVQNKPAITFWKNLLEDHIDNNFELSRKIDAEFGEIIVMNFSNEEEI